MKTENTNQYIITINTKIIIIIITIITTIKIITITITIIIITVNDFGDDNSRCLASLSYNLLYYSAICSVSIL